MRFQVADLAGEVGSLRPAMLHGGRIVSALGSASLLGPAHERRLSAPGDHRLQLPSRN